MDWSECELVERVPGRCSGAPTVKDTRIFPDTIVDYWASGAPVSEIRGDFPTLSEATIRGLIEYAERHQRSSAA